ncbi:signal peptidase I [Polaribacter batillariae]|uniref:Signal peptidase I n=1 Tax=Polaribacter batillariae TaxID=2808900 RepID=A0ABX7SSS8_9FLAO|nr:signal peptidase I [Polaribacter batillariae]QTD37211.1 signal peptidase I [Polaribacter batillariae]
MTFTEWFIFFLVIQVIHFLGTWKLYVKAGRKAWEAAIPIYNGIVLMHIINRPKWWMILLFIPIVNLLMFPVIWIETIRTFGFYKKTDSLLVIVTLGLYIFYINYATDATYNAERSLKPRSELGEWVSSITFAIIAATLVHTYFMQPFTIPTSSLEKSLLVGDYLFVSKFHYGARVPSTVIAAPMVHDSLPFTGTASYLKKPQLPYMRLPGIQKIKNNDIVCFNWPADSLKTMWGDNSGEYTYKPVDKRTNYVKRCVGIAGDSLELKDGYVYINGKKNELPYRAKIQFYYKVYSSKGLSTNKLLRYTNKEFNRKFIIDFRTQNELKAYQNYGAFQKIKDNKFYVSTGANGIPQELIKVYRSNISEVKLKERDVNLTESLAEKLRKDSDVDSVIKVIHTPNNAIFPHVEELGWSQDNFGPIYIPKKGATVKIDAKSLPFYEQIIKNYEGNDLAAVGEDIYINGEKADSYTFKQDYYWLMGDNRHNSLDARYWGYVPFDHVLGKPVMIWFSWDANAATFGDKLKSIRWNRMFTTVGGDGEPVSYRYVVFGLIALYIGYSFYKGNKKKA